MSLDSTSVLLGYAGAGKLSYRVSVAGNVLVEEVQGPPGQWTQRALSKAEAVAIDRLVLATPTQDNSPAAAFWTVAIFSNPDNVNAEVLRVSNSVLYISRPIRCWLFKNRWDGHSVFANDTPQIVTLAFEVVMAADGPHFRSFSINGTASATTTSGVFSGATLETFKGGSAPDFLWGTTMPVWAAAVGLDGGVPLDDYFALPFNWSFEGTSLNPARTLSASMPDSVALVMSLAVNVDHDFTLAGFGAEGSKKALPVYRGKQNGSVDVDHCITMWQRQGSGLSLDQFLSTRSFLYKMSVEVANAAYGFHQRFNDTIVTPYTNALAITDPNELNLLPTLGTASSDPWTASYLINDPSSAVSINNVQFVRYPATAPRGVVTVQAQELAPSRHLGDATPATPILVTLPGLRTEKAVAPLHCTAADTTGSLKFYAAPVAADASQMPTDLLTAGSAPVWRFTLMPASPSLTAFLQKVKMGALDLVFPGADAAASIDTQDDGLFRAAVATSITASIDNDDPDVTKSCCAQRDVSYALPVMHLSPGGQDSVPGEDFFGDPGQDVFAPAKYLNAFKRRPPVVFRPADVVPAPSPDVPFVLTLREKTSFGEDRVLQATLLLGPAGASAPALTCYVFDPEPVLIGKVTANSWAAQYTAAEDNEIGHWSNRPDVDGWQIATNGTSFLLGLPPQAVGEAMHKRVGSGDIVPGTPADFRFSATTSLNLEPAYFAQRYAEAPWNLRRLLGYPGQRAPGAQLDGGQFEIVYGMDTTLSVNDPSIRLAELSALLGASAGAQHAKTSWNALPDQESAYELAYERWAELQPIMRSRLAVLQPWSEQVQSPIFGSDQVSVQLRKQAVLRSPVAGDPLDGFTVDGLPGGWSWGFESRNILSAVIADRTSVAAEIRNLFFSSLGAWGHQRASFDKGRSTIACVVSMGRIESVTIERIGRIEPFWNHAKHVIVYRRTVAATRQFYLEQSPFAGVPVLRKCEEYVELIEAERPFPDAATPVANRGFVKACRFDGIPPRIRVDSTWGGDVSTIGWQVPLWKPDAAPADVYPRPDIGLMFAGKDDGDLLKHSISHPQLVRFYTDTQTTTGSDTDQWPPVESISFTALPATTLRREGIPFDRTADEDVSVCEGTEAFTFWLDDAPAATNVVVDRGPTAISARIHNVTVMRGFQEPTNVPSAPVASTNALRNALGSCFTGPAWQVTQAVDTPPPAAVPALAANPAVAGKALPSTGFDQLTTNLTALQSKAKDLQATLNEPQDLQSLIALFLPILIQRFAGEFLSFGATILSDAETACAAFSSGLVNAAKDLKDVPAGDPIALDTAKDRLIDAINSIYYGPDGVQEMLHRLRFLPGQGIDGLNLAVTQINSAADTILVSTQAMFAELLSLPVDGSDLLQPSDELAGFERQLDDLRDLYTAQAKAIENSLGEPVRPWTGGHVDNVWRGLGIASLGPPRSAADNLLKLRWSYTTTARKDIVSQLQAASDAMTDFAFDAVTRLEDDAVNSLASILADLDLDDVTKPLDDLGQSLVDNVTTIIQDATDATSLLNALNDYLTNNFVAVMAGIPDALRKLAAALPGYAGRLTTALARFLLPTLNQLFGDEAKELFDRLKSLVPTLQNIPFASAVLHELGSMEAAAVSYVEDLARRVNLTVPSVPPSLNPNVDPVLRLLRAFGEPPRLPDLSYALPSFNFDDLSLPSLPPLPRCGYYFFDFLNSVPIPLPHVTLSPLISLASRLLDSSFPIDPLRLHLPVNRLFDRLLPPVELPQFDLSTVMPKWGGLDLTHLFPNLKLPAIANNNLIVTHGEEPSTRSAWMQVDCNLPFGPEPIDVFSLAGITLRLHDAKFTGTSRMEDHLGSPPVENTRGAITGDWDLSIGSFPIVVLEGCSLTFEQGGRLNFDVKPSQVKPQAVLSFLADLLAGLMPEDDDAGLTTAISATGATITLELPLPDISGGTFGIANLSLGFEFGIDFSPEFAIRTGIHISSQDAPFTLTVFILGGAGFFNSQVTYTPRSHQFLATVSVGIFASASLEISLGPISGGIFAYFGITAAFTAGTGRSSSLRIAIVIIFRGEVSLLSFMSVTLCLSLEASYADGKLTGTGTVSYDIKIGFFLHISVHASVSYGFGSAGGKSQAAVAAPARAALPPAQPAGQAQPADQFDDYATRHEQMFA